MLRAGAAHPYRLQQPGSTNGHTIICYLVICLHLVLCKKQCDGFFMWMAKRVFKNLHSWCSGCKNVRAWPLHLLPFAYCTQQCSCLPATILHSTAAWARTFWPFTELHNYLCLLLHPHIWSSSLYHFGFTAMEMHVLTIFLLSFAFVCN